MKVFAKHSRAIWLCACVFLVASVACRQIGPANAPHSRATEKINPITDLVLIYNAGNGHESWTKDRFKPYVYREENGRFEWLFDGFLFLDIYAPSGARTCPISNRSDAGQRDWEDLLNNYFRDGQGIGALDELLNELESKGHTPLRKRKVVIMLPTPIVGSTPNEVLIPSEWGSLDGKKIDLSHPANRIRVAQWYVDEVIQRWKEKKYKHLELAGFYWMFERAWGVHPIRATADYIHDKGYFFYWIPSWPQGRMNWNQLGFDFVYQQPNYFFHRRPTPSDRLETACRFVESCGMTMEMEFNRDLLKKPNFPTYFDEYLGVYARHHVWEKKPVAYYEGEGAWAEMARSGNPAAKSRYQTLANIIVERQNKADAGFIFVSGDESKIILNR